MSDWGRNWEDTRTPHSPPSRKVQALLAAAMVAAVGLCAWLTYPPTPQLVAPLIWHKCPPDCPRPGTVGEDESLDTIAEVQAEMDRLRRAAVPTPDTVVVDTVTDLAEADRMARGWRLAETELDHCRGALLRRAVDREATR